MLKSLFCMSVLQGLIKWALTRLPFLCISVKILVHKLTTSSRITRIDKDKIIWKQTCVTKNQRNMPMTTIWTQSVSWDGIYIHARSFQEFLTWVLIYLWSGFLFIIRWESYFCVTHQWCDLIVMKGVYCSWLKSINTTLTIIKARLIGLK